MDQKRKFVAYDNDVVTFNHSKVRDIVESPFHNSDLLTSQHVPYAVGSLYSEIFLGKTIEFWYDLHRL